MLLVGCQDILKSSAHRGAAIAAFAALREITAVTAGLAGARPCVWPHARSACAWPAARSAGFAATCTGSGV